MKTLKINPLVFIIINVLAPSMYIFIKATYLLPFLMIFSACVLLLMGRFKRLGICALVYLALFGVYSLFMRIEVLNFWGLFVLILMQSFPCAVLALLLVSKYSSAELLSALEGLRLPRPLVVAATITLKYVPTFARELKFITESMRLRGIKFSILKPVSSFRYFIAPQLFRCSALAEEVTAAGLVKGIDAPIRRTSFFEQKIRFTDVALLAVFLIGTLGGLVWAK